MHRQLGQLEAAAMAYVQMRAIRTVRTGDLAAALHLTNKQERELLSRMSRAGLIASVRRGLYLFPERLPLGGVWTPDEAGAINALMTDRGAGYQITGPAAFNYHGFDEQVPSRITLYNDAESGERRIGQVHLTLIKVSRKRLGDTERVQTQSGGPLVYSSRVRTLVDAVYDWSRFDSLPRAYEWIAREIKGARVSSRDLADAAIRYGNMGTLRRIGALFEQMGVEAPVRKKLQRALNPSSATIPFVPGRPKRGRCLQAWQVIVNG